MKRRDVLRWTAAGALAAVAGCVTERSAPRAGGAGDGDGGTATTVATTADGRATTTGTTTDGGDDAASGTDGGEDATTTGREDTTTTTEREDETTTERGEETTTTERGDETTTTEPRDETTTTTTERGDETTDRPGGENDTPEVVGAHVETTDTGCLSGSADGPTVRRGNGVVRITGSVVASDPCHRAVLGNVGYDAGTDVLTVRVGVAGTDRTKPCVECVGAIGYEAVVEFDGGLPGDVRVDETGNAGEPGPEPA